jgi:hypothetical protein
MPPGGPADIAGPTEPVPRTAPGVVPIDDHPVERVRLWLAPLVCLLATSLGICCVLSTASILRSVTALSLLDGRWVGWSAVSAMLAVAAAAATVITLERVGSGPALALGAAAAVVGLLLGSGVDGRGELILAVAACGLAVGGLLAGAAGMVATLPPTWATAVFVTWTIPVVAAWAPLVRALPTRPSSGLPSGGLRGEALADLVVPMRGEVIAAAVLVIVAWSVLTMLFEPVHKRPASPQALQYAWTVLLTVAAMASLVMMVLGFDPQLPRIWLRPAIVVATVAIAAGWGLLIVVLPTTALRLAHVGVTVVAATVPATVTFAVLFVDSGEVRLSWHVVAMLAVVASLGALAGTRRASLIVAVGVTVMTLSALGVWVMANEQWAMFAAAAPLSAAAGAVMVGAFRLAGPHSSASLMLVLTAISAFVVGQVVAVPLSWALMGDVPTATGTVFAAGRLQAGLTVAVASLAAAGSWVLHRRLVAATGADEYPGGSAPSQHRATVDLQDLSGGEARLR